MYYINFQSWTNRQNSNTTFIRAWQNMTFSAWRYLVLHHSKFSTSVYRKPTFISLSDFHSFIPPIYKCFNILFITSYLKGRS